MHKKLVNNAMNIFLLIAGIVLFISSRGIEVGAVLGKGGDFLPKMLAGFWLVLAVVLVWKGFQGPPEEHSSGQIKGFFETLALLFLYIFSLKIIGFTVASAIYCFVQIVLFSPDKRMSWRSYSLYALLSIALPIFINILFTNAFSLILPKGILF